MNLDAKRIKTINDYFKACPVVKAYLFGSYVRGEQGPDSDVDLLVIETEVTSPRQESVRLRRALRGLLIPIDVVVVTSQHVRRHRDTIGLIYSSALKEGRVLYERAAAA